VLRELDKFQTWSAPDTGSYVQEFDAGASVQGFIIAGREAFVFVEMATRSSSSGVKNSCVHEFDAGAGIPGFIITGREASKCIEMATRLSSSGGRNSCVHEFDAEARVPGVIVEGCYRRKGGLNPW
jgi:hypothetical protein